MTRAGCSITPGPRDGCLDRRRSTRATARSHRSATRMGTAGCSRRSPPAFRAGDAGPALVITRTALSRRRYRMHAAYDSAAELAEALRRAAAAHGQHEAQIGHADPDWPDWYAQYMVEEQAVPPAQTAPGAST